MVALVVVVAATAARFLNVALVVDATFVRAFVVSFVVSAASCCPRVRREKTRSDR